MRIGRTALLRGRRGGPPAAGEASPRPWCRPGCGGQQGQHWRRRSLRPASEDSRHKDQALMVLEDTHNSSKGSTMRTTRTRRTTSTRRSLTHTRTRRTTSSMQLQHWRRRSLRPVSNCSDDNEAFRSYLPTTSWRGDGGLTDVRDVLRSTSLTRSNRGRRQPRWWRFGSIANTFLPLPCSLKMLPSQLCPPLIFATSSFPSRFSSVRERRLEPFNTSASQQVNSSEGWKPTRGVLMRMSQTSSMNTSAALPTSVRR